MSKVPKRDLKRDQKLIAEYQLKNEDGSWVYKTTEVAHFHNISTTRLYQILDHYKIPRRSGHDRQPKNSTK